MEKNIFEGARFGDKFVNKDGEVLIYYRNGQYHRLLSENGNTFTYKNNGVQYGFSSSYKDIVGKYRVQLDDEKLDELAESKCWEYENGEVADISYRDFILGYKAGYRKAKEENA